jgi:hypothetical protein
VSWELFYLGRAEEDKYARRALGKGKKEKKRKQKQAILFQSVFLP